MDQAFHYFRTDDSPEGVVTVDGPPKSATDNTVSATFRIQRRIAVYINNDKTTTDKSGFYVRCVRRDFVFYLKLADFRERLGAKDQATLEATYKADWGTKNDALACPGWLADGEEIGVPPVGGGHTIHWPTRGILAPEWKKDDRYGAQVSIWTEIAQTTQNSTASGRLWTAKEPISPRWKIFFAPLDGWLVSTNILSNTLAALTTKEKAGSKNMNLTSWLDFESISLTEAQDRAAKGELVCVSQNLVGWYATYMPVDDVKKMMAAQSNGRKPVDGWMRALPKKEVAEAFDVLVANPKAKTELREATRTLLTYGRPDEERVDAASLMGKQSANAWAKNTLWTGESAQNIAEWLHRSAYSLGPMEVGNYQSPDNLVFGTYESNSDMTRAEGFIRMVVDKTNEAFGIGRGATGTLHTRVTNSGTVAYINAGGAAATLDLDGDQHKWMGTQKFSWLSPELSYAGSFNYDAIKKYLQLQGHNFVGVPPAWNIRFLPFSCYTPLSIEGKVDRMLWDQYFAVTFPFEKPSKKRKASDTADKNHKKVRKTPNHALSATTSTSAFGLSPSTSLVLAHASSLSETAATARAVPHVSATPFSSLASTQLSLVRNPVTATGTSLRTQYSATSTKASVSNTPRTQHALSPHGSLSSIAARVMQTSRLASNTRLKTIMKYPLHQRAWQAASQGAREVKLGDLVVSHPQFERPPGKLPGRIFDGPPPATPPADGFVLVGSINLFGTNKAAHLKSWHGPPPPHVVVGKDLPLYQHAEIDSILASDFLPLLAGTPLDEFNFTNVTFTFQNCNFEPTKPLGWSLTADIIIGPEHGTIHQVFNNILQVPPQSLKLRMLAGLGLGHSWNQPPTISTFVVEGLLDLTSGLTDGNTYDGLPLCDGVKLSRVGLRLSGVRSMTFGIGGKMSMAYGFAIFGDMHVEVPASKSPLEFDFEISEFVGSVQLAASLKGNIWQNAFGSGLDLEGVGLAVSLDLENPRDSLTFGIQAELAVDDTDTTATLSGSYTVHGAYTLQTVISDFGISGIVNFFDRHFGGELSLPPNLDVHIGAISITISSDGGLDIEVDTLTLDKYVAEFARVQMSSHGILVEGRIANVEFPEVDIISLKEASIRLSFEKVASQRSTDVALSGEIEVAGLNGIPQISAAVHIYKLAGAEKADWTVYGKFTALGDAPSLGSLVHELQGTFLANVALQDLMFVAASRDDPLLSSMIPQKYHITQGVQICAILGEITGLRKLMRRATPGLVLHAGYSKVKGLSLDISLPEDTRINLGKGISTDPISLVIGTSPIQLRISAGIQVPVPHAPEPLDFTVTLAIVDEDVSVTGQMHGLWKDPLGVGESVSIGPDLALKIGIVLPVFFVTGLPGELGFAGELTIGEVTGDVAVLISEDPLQELLSGELDKLAITDVVSFAREVTGLEIPYPSNFLDFEKVKLYISTGATLGTLTYPAGFSFEANVRIFGAEMRAAAAVTISSIIVKGAVPHLSVGSLQIKGHEGKDATVDLEVGITTQRLIVDGMFEFLGAAVAVFVHLELLPKPTFQFDFVLHFADFLTFEVDAKMLGATDLKHLDDLDFGLHALFEQHLLDYVRQQLIAVLENAKKKAKEEIDEAKKAVDDAENKYRRDIDAAQSALDSKYAAWVSHQQSVHNASGAIIDKYMASFKSLQDKVDTERKKYDQALQNAENTVQHANADRAEKMRNAEAAVAKAKADWDNDVAQKERELDNAKVEFSRKFGNAEQDIEHAKAKIDGIQGSINDVQNKINDYENAHWYEFWKKAAIPELYIGLATLKAAKGVADGILDACEDVVKGVDFVTAKGLIPLAQDALAAAQKVGDAGFAAAQDTLKGVDRVTAEALTLAQKTLDGIKNGGDAALRTAEGALEEFAKAQKAVLDAAQKAIDDLVRSAEWLAYQAGSAALDLAKHATATLDVAKKALAAIERGEEAIINLGEDVINGVMAALDVQKIELEGTLRGLLGQSGKHFTASVEGIILNKPFRCDNITLDLTSVGDFIHDIFIELVKYL